MSNAVLRMKFGEELRTVNTKDNISYSFKLGVKGEATAWRRLPTRTIRSDIKLCLSAGISESFLNSSAANNGADTAASSHLLSPPPASSSVATVVPGEADNSLESGE